jgi:hypothetical protein
MNALSLLWRTWQNRIKEIMPKGHEYRRQALAWLEQLLANPAICQELHWHPFLTVFLYLTYFSDGTVSAHRAWLRSRLILLA